jgi:ABC-type phosphate/phosphonate transport system permease subunit
MKWMPFVLARLRQNWIRTGSTAAAIAVCIFLFCTLQTFVASPHESVNQGPARLITGNGISRFYSMPNAYEPRIAAVSGVKRPRPRVISAACALRALGWRTCYCES